MFWAEKWKISDVFLWKFSFFGGKIFSTFEWRVFVMVSAPSDLDLNYFNSNSRTSMAGTSLGTWHNLDIREYPDHTSLLSKLRGCAVWLQIPLDADCVVVQVDCSLYWKQAPRLCRLTAVSIGRRLRGCEGCAVSIGRRLRSFVGSLLPLSTALRLLLLDAGCAVVQVDCSLYWTQAARLRRLSAASIGRRLHVCAVWLQSLLDVGCEVVQVDYSLYWTQAARLWRSLLDAGCAVVQADCSLYWTQAARLWRRVQSLFDLHQKVRVLTFRLILLLFFQIMKYPLPTLLTLFTVVGLVDVYTPDQCIEACTDVYEGGNVHTCRECVKNPPVNYVMCAEACSTAQTSLWLYSLCRSCFTRQPLMMEQMCINACRGIMFDRNVKICSQCPTDSWTQDSVRS